MVIYAWQKYRKILIFLRSPCFLQLSKGGGIYHNGYGENGLKLGGSYYFRKVNQDVHPLSLRTVLGSGIARIDTLLWFGSLQQCGGFKKDLC